MSIAILISSPSIFISAGIAATIACYLRFEKAFSLKRLIIIFSTRYSLFAFVCVIYYFFYLQNGNNPEMKTFWKPYFFPAELSAWPLYIKDVLLHILSGLFDSYQCSIGKVVGGLAPLGAYFLWRKQRFIALAFILPFFFAGIAAFGFYPFGSQGGYFGARLSMYLLPLICLLIGQGILPLVQWIIQRIPTKALQISCCLLVSLVCCINILFVENGLQHGEVHKLFTKIQYQYTNEDTIVLFNLPIPVWNYYELLEGVSLPYTVLIEHSKKKDIQAVTESLQKILPTVKKNMYILYNLGHDPSLPEQVDKIKIYLENAGYLVEETATCRARLHRVIPRR